jgi:hypothetical protein
MYTGLNHLHSALRWVLLIITIATIIKAYSGWRMKKSYDPIDNKLSLFTFITFHTQLLVGLGLYFISPTVQLAMADMKAAMKEPVLRFFAIEHLVVMVLSVLVVTVGRILSKKKQHDWQKHMTIFVCYSFALFLVLISIPWPFREVGAGRGWF